MSGLWSRKTSDRVQVVLWREMGETTFSLVGLGRPPGRAGLCCALRVLCCAAVRCGSLRCCCRCRAWEDPPGRPEASSNE